MPGPALAGPSPPEASAARSWRAVSAGSVIDTIAAVCAADDPGAVANLYASEDLAVPTALLQ
jgi:hypothetical protein